MNDEAWMREALREAERGVRYGEIPVGCVVVRDGRLLSRAHDRRESLRDPTAHAELLALREAARVVGLWRLEGCTVYVTLEPCPMCAGAMVLARVSRVVYATRSPKSGAVRSLYRIADDPRLNHRLEVVEGILEDEARALLEGFFRRLREQGG